MDLTLQQLRIFLAVADRESFTAAARTLHLSQSGLSRAVGDIERRLGVPLLERTTRRVALTAEGRELERVARHVLGEYDVGMAHFQGFLTGARGLVRVTTLPSIAATMLPPVVSAFRASHPGVDIRIVDALAGQVLDLVSSGEADLALAVADELPGELTAVPIAADRFSCVFPRGHRFGEDDTVGWRDLAGEPFIAFDHTSSIRRHTDRAFGDAGLRAGPRTEARNIAAVAGLVAAGLGLSAIPALVLPLVQFAGVLDRPLTDPEVERRIDLVSHVRRPHTPPVAAFTAAIRGARNTSSALPPGARWLA